MLHRALRRDRRLDDARRRRRDGMMTRRILVDGEKDFPPFDEGDTVKLIVQGNLLLEYEILKKKEEEK